MSWRYRIVGAIVFTLVAIQSPLAHAQYGYPYGYGNYGWGGWGGGGTVQGSIARGMGAYAAGAGYYNQQRPSPGRSTPTRSCGGTSTSTNRR